MASGCSTSGIPPPPPSMPAKAPQATWVKAFNTLTAGFQASSAGRTGPDRVVIFYATDHDDAAPAAERLIDDAGFDPVRTGTLARTDVGHQEPKGDLYGSARYGWRRSCGPA